MKLVRLTQPAVEPVSLEDARKHLRATESAEDLLIESLISAARDYAEQYCNRIFASASFILQLDGFQSTINLPIDTTAVISISYLDSDDDQQTIGSGSFRFDPLRSTLKPVSSWPSGSSVRIQLVAGPDPSDSPPAFAPPSVISAIKLVMADLFENREAAIVGVTRVDNPAVERLLHLNREKLGV